MKRFYTWLKTQARRDDAIGDLARDARRDSGFPRRGDAMGYLMQRGACSGALDAYRAAREEWRRASVTAT